MAHWDNQARQWALIGEPLRPSQADVEQYYYWIRGRLQSPVDSLTVLILGVTPEIVHIPWPTRTRLLAVDCCESMIRNVLPKSTTTVSPIGLLANWLQLPLPSASVDIVLGDGCYSQISGIDYENLTLEIRRVLKPAGLFLIRFFTKPLAEDSIESIHRDVLAGKIASFHAFKLRLAIALHTDLHRGVCLKDIWNVWESMFKNDILNNMRKLKWSHETIGTINAYHLSNTVYTFPTLDEIRGVFSKHFHENECFTPNYYLGQCCPTFKHSLA